MLEAPVYVVGCSNSSLIENAYKLASSRDVTVNCAQGGYSLGVWATDTAFTTPGTGAIVNPAFDQQLAANPAPVAVWYPVCVAKGDFPNQSAKKREKDAWNGFLAFVAKLRARTAAPLWVTDTIGLGDGASCAGDDHALAVYIAGKAVSDGYAQRSSPDIPAAVVLSPTGCHFPPDQNPDIGAAAAAFLDG